MGAATQQADNIRPPRRGEILALGVDVTARPYDLKALALDGYAPNESTGPAHVYISLTAITADVYFYFAPATANDLDPTAAVAAGGTPAYANTHGWRLVANTEQRLRINRALDKFLVIRTAAATATLLIRASSEVFRGA